MSGTINIINPVNWYNLGSFLVELDLIDNSFDADIENVYFNFNKWLKKNQIKLKYDYRDKKPFPSMKI